MPKFELEPLDDGYYGYRYEVLANNTDRRAGQRADADRSCTGR